MTTINDRIATEDPRARDRNYAGAYDFIDELLKPKDRRQLWPNVWGQDVAHAALAIHNAKTETDEIERQQLHDLYAELLRADTPRPGENSVAMLARLIDELLAHRATRARYMGAARTDGGRIEVETP